MSESENNCCSAKKSGCKCLYAVLHLLILTCIATSLWQISGHLAELAELAAK
ncbi:MAG: hypothetical protein HOI88_03235 [Phycisphaerae bacterium]|jgi:hypothetical protein|nr:hypothetical protein [Phycisphaerae bacterium]MBT5366212.1 hypothetical protein [Phycisphaerae bacterium]MBT6269346.1 hypothetical protein [Phycisphaerae bacterium]MBT6282668.1 hypothetical protein [Phycisphaerae bacterium]